MRSHRLLAVVSFCAMAGLASSVLAGQSYASRTFTNLKFVDLSYPVDALNMRITGTVAVRVKTDDSERVIEAEALSGPAVLRTAAVANARLWKFGPGRREDVIVYRFDIDLGACNDDSRSLFRLVERHLATITACSGPGREYARRTQGDVLWESPVAVPTFPRIAKSARLTGVVVLDLSIAADGRVTEARVVGGVPLLSDAASTHAKTWRVQTESARRAVVVYEFAFDDVLCKPEDWEVTTFNRVSTDHFRLAICGWEPINASSTGEAKGTNRTNGANGTNRK
jgi:outer membrane biosynthesis protein TonB